MFRQITEFVDEDKYLNLSRSALRNAALIGSFQTFKSSVIYDVER